MKRLFRIMATVLSLIMVTATFAGCGLNKREGTTLVWYVGVPNCSISENSSVMRKIYEETGVRIEFRFAQSANDGALQNMVNQNDLPDLITLDKSEKVLYDAVSGNQLYELPALMEQYNVDNFLPTDMMRYNAINGKNYGVISHFWSEDVPEDELFTNNMMIVNRKMLVEAVEGVTDENVDDWAKSVDSLEELENVFSTVRAYYNGTPDRNDGPQYLYYDSYGGQSLVEYLTVPFENADGELIDFYTQPQTKEIAERMGQWIDAGYLSKDVISGAKESDLEGLLKTGKILVYSGVWANSYVNIRTAYRAGEIYVPIGPVKNANGDEPALSSWLMNGYLSTCISKNCSDPEAAIKFLEYLFSQEGRILSLYGVEGETMERRYEDEMGEPFTAEDTPYVDAEGKYFKAKYTALAYAENFDIDVYGYGWLSVLLERPHERYKGDYTEDEAERHANDILYYFSQWAYDSRSFQNHAPVANDASNAKLLLAYTTLNDLIKWNSIISGEDTSGRPVAVATLYDNALSSYLGYRNGDVSYQTLYDFRNARFHELKDMQNIEFAFPTLKNAQ